MQTQIAHINTRLDTIEHGIAKIHKHIVYRDEFEEVLSRLSTVERKLGIQAKSK